MSFITKYLRPITSPEAEKKQPDITLFEETQIEEAQIEEAQIEEAQIEEAQIEEAQIEETQIEKIQIEETQIEEAQVEEAQVEEIQVEEAQIEETQIEETQVEETQVEETQVEETQVEETQVEETQAEEQASDVHVPQEETCLTMTDDGGTGETLVVDEAEQESQEQFTIRTYFERKGISVDFSDSGEIVRPVESLAFNITLNYEKSKSFIRFIRESITRKNFDFAYSTAALPPAERIAVIGLAEKLSDYGIISNYFYNKQSLVIYGTISSAPKVINFINGDFMEMYARCVAVGVARRAAEKHGCDFEVCNNVHIDKQGEKHELDTVIRVGEFVFITEVKSGKFDPDAYRKLGIQLGVVPDRLVLLAADKTDEMCECISYFNEYFICNLSKFKETLVKMIDKAIDTRS